MIKINGDNVIKLETGDNLNVKSVGTKYKADDIIKTIPTQTIVHNLEQKRTRPQLKPTIKDYNDDIEVDNENIPIQRILHNPSKTRRQTQEPYNLNKFENINIEPETEMHKIPSQTIVHKLEQKKNKTTNKTDDKRL